MGSDETARSGAWPPAEGTAARRLGENTRAVHLPPPPVPSQRPLGTPVYRTAAFAFESSAEYAAVLGDAAPGYSYSRIDNPTVDAFAAAVAALESVSLPQRAAVRIRHGGRGRRVLRLRPGRRARGRLGRDLRRQLRVPAQRRGEVRGGDRLRGRDRP